VTNREQWIEKYVQAALEVRGELMLERINAAREAIAERLKQLEGDGNHHSERYQMGSALVSLMVLEGESQRSKPKAKSRVLHFIFSRPD
jgi:hypothetical protein